jgi:hypothetical protein
MRRFFAFLIALAIIGGSFGQALADLPGGGTPCTPVTLERCGAVDIADFVLPTADNGGCGFKAMAAQGFCHADEPRIMRFAVSGPEHALLAAFLAQPERPPKIG